MEEKKHKKRSPLLIAFVVLIVVTIALCATVAGLWLHGRSSMNQEVEAPSLPQQEQTSESATAATFVEYQGKRYQYNENMRNILLMGIDSTKTATASAGDHDQADVLVLAALDMTANKMTLISVSRDTMCNIEVLDQNGNPTYLLNTQLALSYAYGDGQHLSCEMTRDAVSNLFYGLPIQGYGAFYMSGVAALNDAVGGVTLTIADDYPFGVVPGGSQMHPNREKKLIGEEARIYIQMRSETRADANQLRMQRQKQYMLAWIAQAKQLVLDNPASVVSLYSTVNDYVLTNLDIGEISYLATEAASMDFAGDIRSLAGELILNEENYAELHVNDDALFELMLDVFYTEISDDVSTQQSPAVSS